jgi:hypothetical protein
MVTSSLVLGGASSHDGANERRWAAPGCISRAHIQEGLVWSPRLGQVDFTVALFAELLLQCHPISAFDDE